MKRNQIIIKNLMKKRRMYYSDKNYRPVERREREIGFFIVDTLHNNPNLSKKQLFKRVKPSFDKFIDKKIKEFKSDKDVKSDKVFYWIIIKNKKTKLYDKNVLKPRIFTVVVHLFIPNFIAMQPKHKIGGGMSHILCLTKCGELLYDTYVKKIIQDYKR